ncbi:hypothetical protein N7457_000914 [Penicillium paradoxum]|uniref:uncharacterized protein n=1 Tax=Penicillium paradoxum TaxID=176176 RepID=UPI002548C0CF|nr:uncharacterized protein N7457_000914 [Penicillium paradoxum]KAJ5794315.1 hypothetical protein N7457_000914 [Penicillium paradoxum]
MVARPQLRPYHNHIPFRGAREDHFRSTTFSPLYTAEHKLSSGGIRWQAAAKILATEPWLKTHAETKRLGPGS